MLVEDKHRYYLTYNWRNKEGGFMPFLRAISLKMNVIERLEFELVYFGAAFQYFSHYATGTLPLAEEPRLETKIKDKHSVRHTIMSEKKLKERE